MSELSLHHLEHEVEAARAKLASDLAVLTAPTTVSDFRHDLQAGTWNALDAVKENAKAAATSAFQQMVGDLKAKASANPAATLAIGAGIAWRLFHRPPIASALLGVGLYALWRTPRPSGHAESTDVFSRASGVLSGIKEKAQESGAQVSALAHETAAKIKKGASSAIDQSSAALDAVQHATRDIARESTEVTSSASTAVMETLKDEEARDKLLLGAAAVAVVAALGISYRGSIDPARPHEQ